MFIDLYVTNISFEATEEDVRKLFEVVGKVRSIHLVHDHKTGQFKGCGFVKMADVKARQVIDTLDGALLVNRQIIVSEARPRQPGGAKPGGGHGQATRGERPAKRRR